MSSPAKILLIEDDPGITDNLRRVLAEEGHQVAVEKRGDAGLVRAGRETFHVVISDLKVPGVNGLEIVRQLHTLQPRLPIILVTAFGTTETAIEAMQFGAYDYLLKPFDIAQLMDLVNKAVDSNRRMSEPVALGEASQSRDALVGRSAVMHAIYKEIGRVAAKPVTVLIRGETGTGKELIARALYQHSDRASTPFITINCAAIPETLLEAELFGHTRGAFTGAVQGRVGRIEAADGGTLFLDEIGEMPLALQAKLLRFVESGELQRIGDNETVKVDVRVVAATHRPLAQHTVTGAFRADLYYRLAVFLIRTPALVDHLEDLPDLVRHFLAHMGRQSPIKNIASAALEKLRAHSWPGNVRELEHVLERAAILAGEVSEISADEIDFGAAVG